MSCRLIHFLFISFILIFLFVLFLFFFFNDTATTEIYTLSLHDALPISLRTFSCSWARRCSTNGFICLSCSSRLDRKSTRLNSSHVEISYAVFCLKKKKKKKKYYNKKKKTKKWN